MAAAGGWRIRGAGAIALRLTFACLLAFGSLAAGQGGTAKQANDQAGPASQPNAKTRSKLPETSSPPRPLGRAATVDVGMHVLRLTSLDITNNQFALDFWLWFRWADDSLKPYESFELTNGKIDSRQIERIDKVGAVNYACVRVQATLSCYWDVSRFPLGGQRLTVEIEDNDLEADQLVFVPDRDNCGVDGNFKVAGWACQKLSTDGGVHTYATNYGDPRNPAGKQTCFSRAAFALELRRSDLFHSFKVFANLYLAAIVAFTIFFVRPEHRLALTVGAIFAVVASHAYVASYLPDCGVLTLADRLHLITAGVILVSLIETAYALHLCHHGRESVSKRLDRITFFTTAPAYVIANIVLLTW